MILNQTKVTKLRDEKNEQIINENNIWRKKQFSNWIRFVQV